MARPSKYETHVAPRLEEVKDWVRNGATDEEVAKKLGISYSTFKEYKKGFSAFSATLKKGKEVVDAEVESSLLKRALGYSYEEVTKERNDSGVLVTTKVVTKQVIPDTTAQIFWLKNRRPDKWKDKTEISGVEFKVEVPASIRNLTVDELRNLAGQSSAPSTEEFTSGGDDK